MADTALPSGVLRSTHRSCTPQIGGVCVCRRGMWVFHLSAIPLPPGANGSRSPNANRVVSWAKTLSSRPKSAPEAVHARTTIRHSVL